MSFISICPSGVDSNQRNVFTPSNLNFNMHKWIGSRCAFVKPLPQRLKKTSETGQAFEPTSRVDRFVFSPAMSLRVAVNGCGKIGRQVALSLSEMSELSGLELVAINDPIGIHAAAALLHKDISSAVARLSVEEGHVRLPGLTGPVRLLSNSDPLQLPWAELGVDLVIDATGAFVNRASASKHLQSGAKKVLIATPAMDASIPSFVYGVNHFNYSPTHDDVVSSASWMTNCVAPFLKILHDRFEVMEGSVTATHPLDERIVGTGRNLKMARAAEMNVSSVLPALMGKICAVDLPVANPNASLVDVVLHVKSKVFAEHVNAVLRAAALTAAFHGILAVSKEPVADMDYSQSSASSVVDPTLTTVIGDHLIKIIASYDAVHGYSQRVIDLAGHIASTWPGCA